MELDVPKRGSLSTPRKAGHWAWTPRSVTRSQRGLPGAAFVWRSAVSLLCAAAGLPPSLPLLPRCQARAAVPLRTHARVQLRDFASPALAERCFSDPYYFSPSPTTSGRWVPTEHLPSPELCGFALGPAGCKAEGFPAFTWAGVSSAPPPAPAEALELVAVTKVSVGWEAQPRLLATGSCL